MVQCPACGEENPQRFRLCGFCGAELAAPQPVREVRKTVTVVFSDLKGSTAMGEKLDSEAVREVMSRYFDEMRAALERYGGTVEKYIGDAIMAVFGLPLLHEDDALRAVRAAAEMRDALTELNAELERAIRDSEQILIHGDYDVDGMCSTTLLTRTLRMLGASVIPFIPRRIEDGYDLGAAGVEAALRAGVRVVVTCDCGTSAHEPVRALQDAGVDVIISDHHLPSGGVLPAAYAVLNPKRPGCTSPDRDLAAVGVAFKLALALVRKRGGNENAVYRMLDLVA